MGAEPLAHELLRGEGSLIAGDLGLLAVRALVESGVGYVVTGWTDRPTPIDAAIGDLRRSVLEPAGVRLRRLRDVGSVATVVQNAGIGVPAGSPMPRGAVVWNGRTGMVPALERFCALEVPAPVIGFCFDTAVCRSSSAYVVDPGSSAAGFRDGVGRAFALSAALARPVLVLVRPRLLGIRAVVAGDDRLDATDAAALDARVPRGLAPDEAGVTVGLTRAGDVRSARGAVLCGEHVAGAVVETLRVIDDELRAAGASSSWSREVAVVACTVPNLGLARETRGALAELDAVLVLDGTDTALHRTLHGETRAERRQLDLDAVTALQVRAAVIRWLRGASALVPDAHPFAATLDALLARAAARTASPLTPDRLVRRDAAAVRELPDVVSAALVLAQVELGIPTRIDPAWRTWRTDRGSFLTVVTVPQLATQGPACVAPGTPPGVFVAVGALTAELTQAAAAMGATLEAVDGSDARAMAVAIARASVPYRTASHVIVGVPVATTVDAAAEPGFDAELLGVDRLSLAPLAPGSVGVYERQGDLECGPAVGLVNPARAAMGVRLAARLSPAWYELRARRGAEPFARRVWQLRRRILRTVAGVDA